MPTREAGLLAAEAGIEIVEEARNGSGAPRGQTTAVEALNKAARLPTPWGLALVRGLARNPSGERGNVTTNLLDALRKVRAWGGLGEDAAAAEATIAGLDLREVEAAAVAGSGSTLPGYPVGALAEVLRSRVGGSGGTRAAAA